VDDLTGTQIAERRLALESASASLLGRLLFEFSYLDTNLGLCLAWVGGGTRLEGLSRKVQDFGFSKRLDSLKETVEASLPADSKARMAYAAWLQEAHAARKIRNELVHGRWAVDVRTNEVLNIVGLPTSDEQRVIRYSLSALEGQVVEIKRLLSALNKLRDRWPL
jgi:hypothetical protein